MSILIDETTPVLVQGMTGDKGTFHAKEMIAYGTNVVGGVTPGKGGGSHLDRPLFNTMKEAVKATGATTTITFVAPAFCADAIMEAADAGVRLICSITDGIPAQDMMRVKRYLMRYPKDRRPMMVGPNCAGIISPGKAMLGIMPGHIYLQGKVGVISRSGTLGYEAASQMKAKGIGITTSVGIGGDPINGSSFLDHLALFEEDPGDRGGADDRRDRRPAGGRGLGLDQGQYVEAGDRLRRRADRAQGPAHGPCRRHHLRRRRQRRREGRDHALLRAHRGAQSERVRLDRGGRAGLTAGAPGGRVSGRDWRGPNGLLPGLCGLHEGRARRHSSRAPRAALR